MSDSTRLDDLTLPGRIVAGKYEIQRVLGEGGAGVVVAAKHLHFRRAVALKFLRADDAQLAERIRAFSDEARAMFDIVNEHVVRVFDLDRLPDGRPFMVMELLEGHDLRSQMPGDAQLDPAYVAELGRQICDALVAAHAVGVVHCDIKPENIWVASGPRGAHFKLLDFGISRHSPTNDATGPIKTVDVTSGTPAYMSPEQLRASADFDARTDLWSLGCVMYELLCGVSPFDGATPEQCCAAVLVGACEPLRAYRPKLDLTLEAVVMRCLDRDASARFSSALELEAALAAWLAQHKDHAIELQKRPPANASQDVREGFRRLKTLVTGKRARRSLAAGRM